MKNTIVNNCYMAVGKYLYINILPDHLSIERQSQFNICLFLQIAYYTIILY